MDKIKNQLQISVSNDGFVDEGEGVVSFPNGLTITDSSVMRSGTRYDVPSLNINDYAGQLTADHQDSLGTLIGKTIGVTKEGGRVAIQGIKYAVKENPYARLAYDLLVGGFSNSFSIETIGPYADEGDRTYRNHELVGLSQVVVPNNYNATINQFNEIVHNSLERSQQDGLDVTGIEEKIVSSMELKSSEIVDGEDMAKDQKEVDTSKVEETPVVETVEPETTEIVETEVTEAPTEEVVAEDKTDVQEEVVVAPADSTPETEVKSEAVVTDKSGTVAPQPSEEPVEEVREETPAEEAVPEVKEELKEVVEDKPEEKTENNTNKKEETLEMTAEQIAEIVANSVATALKPVTDELAATKELAQNALDAQAKEPEFTPAEVAKNSYDEMGAEELFAKQLNAAVAVERMGSIEGAKTLREINERNLNALKDEKIVNRALTLEDLGNFVIAPELYRDIEQARTDYTAILNATQWRETNSLEFAWLTRTSDIDMQNVAIGALGDVASPDVDANGIPTNDRLKPVSVPSYGAHSDKLEEMAAVTPISINVIRFAAADILADVAEGYRNDYDRKRAQLVIIRLQQAVNASTNTSTYDMDSGLAGWSLAVAEAGNATTIGTLVFSNRTLSQLKAMAIESQNSAILTELGTGNILGTPFVVVPNDLMPTLGTAETRVFQVAGANVTINQAVFYGDLRTFTGRTSGGLKYDVDGSASYEVFADDGSRHVFSAYQRNEIVLRGSFLRGGVVKDTTVIAGIAATAPVVTP